jgi:hypothetical protein
MKAFATGIIMAVACMFFSTGAFAQGVKGAKSYFPKAYPAPAKSGQAGAGAVDPSTGRPIQPPQTGVKPQPPKFKDLPVNSQFYFLSDTNRAYGWNKISNTTATNSKNGVVQMINAETPIQK